MKIKYKSVTDSVEVIDVTEEWASVLVELDRLDHNRNQTETRRHCSLEAFNLDGEMLSTGEDIEEDILRQETFWEVRAAVAQLPPRQREVIERLYFLGQTGVEVAAAMGINRGTVADYHAAAKKNLRKILGDTPH